MSEITQDSVFSIQNPLDFEEMALRVFQYQVEQNPVYHSFVKHLGIDSKLVDSLQDIPFLPIEFFKTQEVISGKKESTQQIFSSSGTTGMQQSLHYVTDISWYEASFNNAFQLFYGDIKEYTVLALLPSYLERDGSSLIYMCEHLIQQSESNLSGFYLNEFEF